MSVVSSSVSGLLGCSGQPRQQLTGARWSPDRLSDRYAYVGFETPAEHALEIDTNESETAVEADEQLLDCNTSVHVVLIREDAVDDISETTLAGC